MELSNAVTVANTTTAGNSITPRIYRIFMETICMQCLVLMFMIYVLMSTAAFDSNMISNSSMIICELIICFVLTAEFIIMSGKCDMNQNISMHEYRDMMTPHYVIGFDLAWTFIILLAHSSVSVAAEMYGRGTMQIVFSSLLVCVYSFTALVLVGVLIKRSQHPAKLCVVNKCSNTCSYFV